MTAKPVSAPLSPEIADRLLDLLSTDDAFRARFQRDPRAALHEVGYVSPEPAKMTACGAVAEAIPESLIDCKVDTLAPKQVISEARAEIRAMLTAGLSQTTPRLEATERADVLRLRK
jgi:putative modified peptide